MTENLIRPGDTVTGREAADLLPDGAVVQIVQYDGYIEAERRIVGSDVGAGLVEYRRGVSTIHPSYFVLSIPGDAVRRPEEPR